LAGYEKALGPEHPDTLSSVYNLATLVSHQGDYAGAEALHRRALAGREKALGPEHPDTLESVNNLVITLNALGRLPEAVQLLRQKAALSPAALAAVRYNLACYECLTGNHNEARRLIAEEVAARPGARQQALQDDDLKAIRDFIQTL
jgi:tetratricopeptide (TPR) repeat protein